jgi:hypothetical protein
MKKSIFASLVSLLILLVTGCAPVQFYSNKGLTEKTGLKYYAVKPFLSVEREPKSGKIVKTSIIYLPDLANPQYMVLREGINSRKLNLKFKDGTITDFGYSSTGKVGESVEALGSLISKGADALTAINALRDLQAATPNSNSVELYEIVFGPDRTTLKEVTVVKQ